MFFDGAWIFSGWGVVGWRYVLFRASWNHIFFQPVFLTFKSNLIEMRNTALIFSNNISLHIIWSAVVCRCSSKLGVLKHFANFTGKHQHRCFPVKLANISRTPFLKSTSGGCFCTYCTHMTSHAIWVDEITYNGNYKKDKKNVTILKK